ncbi:MAG: CHRD domain-containing protein, partial [Microcoleus sp. SIO2G3]|nr:CHRD domain-containing protein [Microcoleus sp. SIO2G3]
MTSNSISLSAALSGSQEVPPVSSPATGTSNLTLDAANNLSYRLVVSGVDLGQARAGRPDTPNTNDDVTLFHIHNAGRGVNGPVVFDLLGDEDADDFKIELNPGGSYTISGIWEPTDNSTVSINNFASAIR